jgi:hypothetical protein
MHWLERRALPLPVVWRWVHRRMRKRSKARTLRDASCMVCGEPLLRDGQMTGVPFVIGEGRILCAQCGRAEGIA